MINVHVYMHMDMCMCMSSLPATSKGAGVRGLSEECDRGANERRDRDQDRKPTAQTSYRPAEPRARQRLLLKPMPRKGENAHVHVQQELRQPRTSLFTNPSGGGGGGGGGTVRKLLRSKNGLVPKRRTKLHASDSTSNATTPQRLKQQVRDLSVSDADAAASGALEYMDLDAHMKGEVGRAVATRHRNRVIVPLFSNLVIMPFLKNMLCSMARLQVENWAVVSLDMETCGALQARGFATARDSCVEPYQFRPLSDEAHKNESFKHGSPHFWRLVIQRPLWVQWMMQQGYSVLQCDVDVVWLHNPLLHFEMPAMQQYSAFYQSEQVYGMNCGFYFMRPDQAALGCVPLHALGSATISSRVLISCALRVPG